MFETDYDRIQVRDVADAAGVALGTIYRYFNSKDHLFACALHAWSAGFESALARTSGGPTLDRVKATFRLAVRAFEKQPRVYAVMIQMQSSKDPHACEVFRAFASAQVGAFGSVLDGSRLPDDKRRDVIAVMSAVLDDNLRRWQLGLATVADVYTAVDRAADLILNR